VTLATVVIVTTVTLVVGYASKQACFVLGFRDSFYCFSDYGPLYFARELAGGRFPYLPPPLEYPVGMGLMIWLASAVSTFGSQLLARQHVLRPDRVPGHGSNPLG
jgi:hypothetical protein